MVAISVQIRAYRVLGDDVFLVRLSFEAASTPTGCPKEESVAATSVSAECGEIQKWVFSCCVWGSLSWKMAQLQCFL